MASRTVTAQALVLVGLFGLLWAHALGFTRLVDPTDIDWMLAGGDWMENFLGWLFARAAPWSLPLGSAPDLLAPHGTNAAMTDSIPLLTTLGKVVSPLFGDRLQLFGLWMLAAVIATGVAGVLVCRAWFDDLWSLVFAGCLLVMNPIVTTRYGHPSLMMFWVFIALVGLCFWPLRDARGVRRVNLVALAVLAFACGVHGYVAVMCGALAFAAVLRAALLDRLIDRPEALGWLVAVPLVGAFALWLFGYLQGSRGEQLTAEGFGQFSADLLTFVNPSTMSRFFGPLPMGPRQYEGYAYLGLGTLGLLGLRLVGLAKWRPSRGALLQLAPVWLACLLLATYALSSHVTLLGRPIADLSAFYARLEPWPSVFRGSGRFVFPLFALLTLIAVRGVGLAPAKWRAWFLGSAALLQFVDVDPQRVTVKPTWQRFATLQDPAWQLMGGEYRHIVIQPIQLQWICPFDGPLVAKLSWEAYRQHLTINSAHVPRPPPGYSCTRHLTRDELRDDTVYVPYFKEHLGDFVSAGFVCAAVEQYMVCVSPARETRLLGELRRRRGH